MVLIIIGSRDDSRAVVESVQILFEHEQESGFLGLHLSDLVVGEVEPDCDAHIYDDEEACEGDERPKVGPVSERFVVVPC